MTNLLMLILSGCLTNICCIHSVAAPASQFLRRLKKRDEGREIKFTSYDHLVQYMALLFFMSPGFYHSFVVFVCFVSLCSVVWFVSLFSFVCFVSLFLFVCLFCFVLKGNVGRGIPFTIGSVFEKHPQIHIFLNTLYVESILPGVPSTLLFVVSK